MKADAILDTRIPLIVIAAHSQARLLEAEIIHMQYRQENRPGRVIAIAESQLSVTRKQYERAGYFTHKTVVFNQDALRGLMAAEVTDMPIH